MAREIPDIRLCISTNGLSLPDHVDELAEMNVDHVTITINHGRSACWRKDLPLDFTMVSAPHWYRRCENPARTADVGAWRMLAERGILTKVNSVNDPASMMSTCRSQQSCERPRRVAAQRNAANFKRVHGTYYGLTGQRGPEAFELQALQDV